MKSSRALLLCVAALMAVAGCESDTTTGPAPVFDRYVIPGATVYPEGVATDESASSYFVGSTTDGTIFRGLYSDSTAKVFSAAGSDGRTTVVGIKVDSRGRLFAAGGATGTVYVYNARTGAFLARLSTGAAATDTTFLNDLTVAPSGNVYVTDSRDSVIYRVTEGSENQFQLDRWLPLAGTPLTYRPGFNLNGIVATPDERYLLTVQSNTGKLFRVTVADRSIIEVSLGADTLTNGDGMLLDGQKLYVVRNRNKEIVRIDMSADFNSGTVASRTTNASFDFPTTIARAGDRLLLVNAQLNKRTDTTLTLTLPFTLSSVPIP